MELLNRNQLTNIISNKSDGEAELLSVIILQFDFPNLQNLFTCHYFSKASTSSDHLSWYSGFLSGLFRGVGDKIYCYANFFVYANFPIVIRPNFRDQKSPRGANCLRGSPLPPGGRKPIFFNPFEYDTSSASCETQHCL